jgi:sugar/nucleoside kinase (ribokinase family)
MDEVPQVVVVGAACRDLVDDDPRGWRLGGGASYAALALARLGLRVGALVVADDEAVASTELRLVREAGVDLRFVPGARGPIFINVETPGGRLQRAPQMSDPVPPEALPEAWRSAGAWMLAPVASEVRDEWADVPPPGALVAVGWQGLLRVLFQGEPVERHPPGPSPIVRRADLVGVGRDDVDPGTQPEALAEHLHPGATMLFTDAARGGVAYTVGERASDLRARTWESIPIRRYVDPVGAGDTFLAAVFAAWVDPSITDGYHGPDPDLRLGAACASLILEGPGVFAVPHLGDALLRMQGVASPGGPS